MKIKYLTLGILSVLTVNLIASGSDSMWNIEPVDTGIVITNKTTNNQFSVPLDCAKSKVFTPKTVFSPDQTLICIGNGYNETAVWDVANQKELFSIGTTATNFEFSPKGNWLLVYQFDGSVEVWNVKNPNDPQQLIERLLPNEESNISFLDNESAVTVQNLTGIEQRTKDGTVYYAQKPTKKTVQLDLTA